MPRHSYNNFKAIQYAKEWCGKEDNSCGVFFDGEKGSDCAHYIAHVLAAGGIKIENTFPELKDWCPENLAIRNVDLVNKLKELSTKYDNIFEIDLTEAIVGDVGFLKIERPRHAFMVCTPWEGNIFTTPKVYAHSTSRCCEYMDAGFKQWLSDAFRLEDG